MGQDMRFWAEDEARRGLQRLSAIEAVAKKIVSIGGTQSKLGKVYLAELAALTESGLPNGPEPEVK